MGQRTLSILKRKVSDEETAAQLAALAERVHPTTIRATCGWCGMWSNCGRDSASTTTGLDDQALTWHVCTTCAALLGRKRLDREVVAGLLGVDPGSPLLADVQVEAFRTVPGARPDKPNDQPWQHVSTRELGRQLDRLRHDREARTASHPCAFCGTIEKPDGGDFGYGPEGRPTCPSCSWHIGEDRQFLMRDGRRDYVAAWMLGDRLQSSPPGLGAQLGIRFAYEVDGWPGARGPWRHLDGRALKRRAKELGIETDRMFSQRW